MSNVPDHRTTQNDYAFEAGAAGAALIFTSSYFIGGWLGVKAGKNHYPRTGDMVDATAQGIHAGRRWTAWILGCWALVMMGMFSLWMLSVVALSGYEPYNDGRGNLALRWTISLFASGVVLWAFMGVIYVRNMDASLFRRGWLYRRLRPLAVRLDNWSNITLYCGFVFVPWAINMILLVAGVV